MKMKDIRGGNWNILVIGCLFFVLLLAGCGSAPAGQPDPTEPKVEKETARDETGQDIDAAVLPEKRVKVVATIFPLADIVGNVGGELVEVTTLLAPGASPHTFEPTVEQARFVADADLVFFIGGGLDDWAVRLAEAAGDMGMVAMMDTVEAWVLEYNPIHLDGEDHDDHNHHDHDNGHEHDHHTHIHNDDQQGQDHHHHHGPHDPHIWLDPVLVKDIMAPQIAEKLQGVYPGGSTTFQANLANFQEELELLNWEIADAVKLFQQSRFISYHSAWNYFARRYGLEEVAAVEEFPGKEPSAKWMAELVKLAAAHDIRVIFAEPQFGGNAARVIAEEIGGEVLLLDPLGGKGVLERESYLELMRYNLLILTKAMQ